MSDDHVRDIHLPVRLALLMGIVAAAVSVVLLLDVVGVLALSAAIGIALGVGSILLGAAAATVGILGSVYYGLFASGCGARVIRAEKRRGRIGTVAGATGQLSVYASVVLTAVLVVQLAA
jgi:hypothetical protein